VNVLLVLLLVFFFFSSRRRHTRLVSDWSSDVCSSDLGRSFTSKRVGKPGDVSVGLNFARLLVNDRPRAIIRGRSRVLLHVPHDRSEERRVGKECRYRWWGDH